MVKVDKELKYLKEKQNEQQGKLMGDDEITSLQRGIQWFKSAAVKLNLILDKQRQEINRGKFIKNHQQKDLSFLTDHLKDAKKQNKLLKLANEKSKEQNGKLAAFFINNAPQQLKQFDPSSDLA